MTDRFPERYEAPKLESVGGSLLEGWGAACNQGSSPSGCGAAVAPIRCSAGGLPSGGGSGFSPHIVGDGL